MFAGVHGEYAWEILDGELRVECRDPRVGHLKTFDGPTSFNNAEQATWFAQGRIDIHGEELAALRRARLAGDD